MAGSMRVAKNTLFLYVRMVFVLLVQLYVSRVLLQQLGVVDYGLYNVIGGIVLMLGFVNSTAAGATSRFLTFSLAARDKDLYDYRTIFSLAFFIHLAIAVVLVIVAETAGVWYFDHYLVIPHDRVEAGWWVLQLSIATCLISFTQVPYNASLIAHEHMNVYALVGMAEAVMKLAIAYVLAFSDGDRLIVYALLMFCLTVSFSLFYRIYCIRSFGTKCRLQLSGSRRVLKMLLSYSFWDLIGCLGGMARNQGVNIILNAFFGPAVNAARAIAFQVENGLNSFTGNFQTAARPVIIKRYAEGDIPGMLRLFYVTCEFSLILYSLLAVPILMETDSVLAFWLVNPPQETAVFIQFVILTYFASSINSAIGIGVHATGDVKRLNLYAGTKIFPEIATILLFFYWGYPAYTAFAIMCIYSCLIMWVDVCVLKKNISAIKFGVFFRCVLWRAWLSMSVPLMFAYVVHTVLIVDVVLLRVAVVGVAYWLALVPAVWFWGMDDDVRIYVRTMLMKRFGGLKC